LSENLNTPNVAETSNVITNVNKPVKFKIVNYIVTDNIEDTELTKFILDKIDNIKTQFPDLGIVANVLDKAKKRSVYYIDTITSKKLGLDNIIGSDIFNEIDKNHNGQGSSVDLEKLSKVVSSEIQEKIKTLIQDLKVVKDQIQSFEVKLNQVPSSNGGEPARELTTKEYFLDTSRILNSNTDVSGKLDVEKFDTFKEKTLKDILDTNNKIALLQAEVNKIDELVDTKVNARLQTDGLDSKINTKVNEILNTTKTQIKQELTTELVKEFAKLIPSSSGSSGSNTPANATDITEQRVNEILQVKLTELSSSLNIDKVVQDKLNLVKDLLIQNIEQKAEAKVQEVLNASIDQKIDDRVEVKTSAISQTLDNKIDGKINDKLNVKSVEIYNSIDTKINDKLAVKLVDVNKNITNQINTETDKINKSIDTKVNAKFDAKLNQNLDERFESVSGQVDSKVSEAIKTKVGDAISEKTNDLIISVNKRLTENLNLIKSEIDTKIGTKFSEGIEERISGIVNNKLAEINSALSGFTEIKVDRAVKNAIFNEIKKTLVANGYNVIEQLKDTDKVTECFVTLKPTSLKSEYGYGLADLCFYDKLDNLYKVKMIGVDSGSANLKQNLYTKVILTKNQEEWLKAENSTRTIIPNDYQIDSSNEIVAYVKVGDCYSWGVNGYYVLTNILLQTKGLGTYDYWMSKQGSSIEDSTIYIKFDKFIPSKMTISAGTLTRRTLTLSINVRAKIDLGNFTYKDLILFDKENASLSAEADPNKNNLLCKPNTYIFTREDYLDSFN
jgi:hypothetical protein